MSLIPGESDEFVTKFGMKFTGTHVCIPMEADRTLSSVTKNKVNLFPTMGAAQVVNNVIQDALVEAQFDLSRTLSLLSGTLSKETVRNYKKNQDGDVWEQLQSFQKMMFDKGTPFIRGYVIFILYTLHFINNNNFANRNQITMS